MKDVLTIKDWDVGKMEKSAFQKMLSIVEERYPQFATRWRLSRESFGEEWEYDLSRNIEAVFGKQPTKAWNAAIDGYAEFSMEAMRAQVYFEKTGRYPAENYEDCVKKCYNDHDYMVVRYLPGQYLSHYIWPHHYAMNRHFRNDLLPRIPEVKLFYEVGVGCGLYSQIVLECFQNARGVGVDISSYALNYAHSVIKAHGMGDRYSTNRTNILDAPVRPAADLVISQEVLEHLEDPLTFIRSLRDMAQPEGWGYITAAVNAAHTDHIYLYSSPDEVVDQVKEGGWNVIDIQIEANADTGRRFNPTIVGVLAQKGY